MHEEKSTRYDTWVDFFTGLFQMFFGTTIGWMLWDDAIPAILPTVVKAGHLPADVGFWSLFGFVIIAKLMIPFSLGTKTFRYNQKIGKIV